MSNWLKNPAKTERTPGAEPKTSHTVTSPGRPEEMRTMRDTSWPSHRTWAGGSTTGASMLTSYSRSRCSMRACATAPTGRKRSPESQLGWSPGLVLAAMDHLTGPVPRLAEHRVALRGPR